MRNPRLWQKLEAFRVTESTLTLSFKDRLARDNNWGPHYAGAVYDEYLRFVYLMAVSDEPLTPSDAVDQAWHLHLAYSRSYWQALCRDIIGHPLHHGPTKGGVEEGAKFHDWYQRTLDSYAEEFGEPPPSQIWPEPSSRFSNADALRRIDLSGHYLLKKRDVYAAVTTVVLALAATNAFADGSRVEGLIGAALIIVGVPALILLAVRLLDRVRKTGGKRDAGCSDSGGYGGCGGCGGCGG